ncbi:hypothetical protein DOTSEDRAFT_142749 [Dothistroma septosporum NZE10]|uniref:Uncharacterized protein n=1 Tax=Dothistroma septosporum (strain NZE10 / CBS 128990) TaxID=675120 RepID=N1Q023_DOTSN|nr:hypothetical protein DOTSEDRAFT_142749 [Dothistroma septosporum NZE10]
MDLGFMDTRYSVEPAWRPWTKFSRGRTIAQAETFVFSQAATTVSTCQARTRQPSSTDTHQWWSSPLPSIADVRKDPRYLAGAINLFTQNSSPTYSTNKPLPFTTTTTATLAGVAQSVERVALSLQSEITSRSWYVSI